MRGEDLTLLEQYIIKLLTTVDSHTFVQRAKLFGHVSITLYRASTSCLACQHFDLNSTNWFSDSQHMSSS